MENTILIKKDELRQQTDLRNHYMGEALKRRDINADIIQSSSCDDELFDQFLETACNELISIVALRFPHISCTVDKEYVAINFTTTHGTRPDILPLLRQATKDYLVNELTLQWLLLRQPESAQSYISLRTSLFVNVQQQFAKLMKNKVRRRATDLAGI